MIDRQQLNQYAVLNRSPLNQAALKHLPAELKEGPGLHVLALALWAAQTYPPAASPELAGAEEVVARVAALADSDPEWALKWLSRGQDGLAEQLETLPTPEAAQALTLAVREQIRAA